MLSKACDNFGKGEPLLAHMEMRHEIEKTLRRVQLGQAGGQVAYYLYSAEWGGFQRSSSGM